jgi:hypothetical protein
VASHTFAQVTTRYAGGTVRLTKVFELFQETRI